MDIEARKVNGGNRWEAMLQKSLWQNLHTVILYYLYSYLLAVT